MRIVLINPYPSDSAGINEATIYPPIGLAYLAGNLRKNGFTDVSIIDANIMKIPNEKVIETLKVLDPLIVGIHLNVILGRSGIELSQMIKKQLCCKVIVGGPLTSSNPEEVLKLSKADVAVIGEGEEAIVEIARGHNFEDIKGLAVLVNDKLVLTEPRPLIENLDSLPLPAYNLLPSLSLYKSRARKKPVGVIMTSRGCPYQCTFCNASVFGKRFRSRSPESVVAEIEYLVDNFHIKQLDVLDDNFTLDIGRAEKILDLLISKKIKLAINLQNGVRADRVNEQLIKKMKKAGVFKVGMGVESGDVEMLKMIKKSLSLDKVKEAIRLFRKYKIITVGFFILGFPHETKESIEKTINFAIEANPSIANFCILLPFPGTEIHKELKEMKALKDENLLFYDSGFYANTLYHTLPGLTERELLDYQNAAYKKFNFRPKKILETFTNIRSPGEFAWTAKAALPLIKNIVGKKK
jgi:radical SAM superfamily enzyme YgiQ (UPF0313 family)